MYGSSPSEPSSSCEIGNFISTSMSMVHGVNLDEFNETETATSLLLSPSSDFDGTLGLKCIIMIINYIYNVYNY